LKIAYKRIFVYDYFKLGYCLHLTSNTDLLLVYVGSLSGLGVKKNNFTSRDVDHWKFIQISAQDLSVFVNGLTPEKLRMGKCLSLTVQGDDYPVLSPTSSPISGDWLNEQGTVE
jgi:hypothetical protein